MAQKRKISEQEWQRLLPLMESFASVTTDVAYAVLVKGESQVEVAARKNRSKQSIAISVKRVWEFYQNATLSAEKGEPLRLVNVWLPEKYAEQVMIEASKYAINEEKIS